MAVSFRQFLSLTVTDQKQGLLISLFKAFLWLLSCGYYLGLNLILFSCRVGLLRKYKLPRPVLSVGNITWGGVGKTPFVIWLVQRLQEQNLKPVILTRGYKAKENNGKRANDEVKMFQEILKDVPVLVGKNRYALAREFLKTHDADVFILDDGFQHWRLCRDIDIVLIDSTNPWGNRKLLPRGILREPLSALHRAQAVILTKTDLGQANVESIKSYLNKSCPNVLTAETIHKAVILKDIRSARTFELSTLKNKRIACLCGIGNPKSFEVGLRNLGANVIKNFTFMDHHAYQKSEIEKIVQECLKENIDTIVITQKDAVKLAFLTDVVNREMNILYLHIHMSFTRGENEFFERVRHIILS